MLSLNESTVMPPPPSVDGPPGFHLLAKPSGSTCRNARLMAVIMTIVFFRIVVFMVSDSPLRWDLNILKIKDREK